MSNDPIVILGAGPTGLGAAWRLHERGERNVRILEAAPSAGGLASSFTDHKGFTWDLGSHLQFSHYEYYDRLLDTVLTPDDWWTHQRSTWVKQHDQDWVPYPFQLNLHRLSPQQRWECLRGLLQAQNSPDRESDPANFQQWMLATFGEGITQQFLQPYNEKIWASDLQNLSADWVKERVAAPELITVLAGICLEQDHTGWGPNATFRYPRHGGTGSIWRKVADHLPADWFVYDQSVTAIDAARHLLTTAKGTDFEKGGDTQGIPLPNVGREAHTYLPHIIQHYEELAEVTVFLQGGFHRSCARTGPTNLELVW